MQVLSDGATFTASEVLDSRNVLTPEGQKLASESEAGAKWITELKQYRHIQKMAPIYTEDSLSSELRKMPGPPPDAFVFSPNGETSKNATDTKQQTPPQVVPTVPQVTSLDVAELIKPDGHGNWKPTARGRQLLKSHPEVRTFIEEHLHHHLVSGHHRKSASPPQTLVVNKAIPPAYEEPSVLKEHGIRLDDCFGSQVTPRGVGEINKMALANIAEYRRMRELARHHGLIK